MPQKRDADLGEPIARIVESDRSGGGLAIAVILLAFGTCLTIVAVIGDTSAIRQASYGAVGTVWNVLWGTVALLCKRKTYTVYRMPEK